MRSVVFLLSVLALAQAKAVEDPELDAYIRAILELFKAQMSTGIPELGIPVLDPFDIPHFDIPHIDDDVADVDITIDNLVITNLATFETKLAHLDLEGLGLELELTIFKLRGDAEYTLDGSIFGIFPLYGEGPMWLEIYGLDLYAKAAVLINAEGFLEVTTMDITADFIDIKLHLDNILGGGDFGETINTILNIMGGYIWDQLKDILFPILDDVLKKVINDALAGCSIADLIENGSCFQNELVLAARMGRTTFPIYKI
jgi:hypothetical protein